MKSFFLGRRGWQPLGNHATATTTHAFAMQRLFLFLFFVFCFPFSISAGDGHKREPTKIPAHSPTQRQTRPPPLAGGQADGQVEFFFSVSYFLKGAALYLLPHTSYTASDREIARPGLVLGGEVDPGKRLICA